MLIQAAAPQPMGDPGSTDPFPISVRVQYEDVDRLLDPDGCFRGGVLAPRIRWTFTCIPLVRMEKDVVDTIEGSRDCNATMLVHREVEVVSFPRLIPSTGEAPEASRAAEAAMLRQLQQHLLDQLARIESARTVLRELDWKERLCGDDAGVSLAETVQQECSLYSRVVEAELRALDVAFWKRALPANCPSPREVDGSGITIPMR